MPYLSATELDLARRIRETLGSVLASPTAFLAMLPDARLLVVNRAFETLMGRARDELLGRPATDLLVPRERQIGVAAVEAVARDATAPFPRRWEVMLPHGGTLPVHTTTVVVRRGDGAPWYLVSRVEEERSGTLPVDDDLPVLPVARSIEDDELVAQILAAIPDFAESLTPMAAIHVDGRIITANAAFAGPLEYEPGALVGRTVFELGAEPPAPDQAIRVARLLAEGMIPALTRTMRTRSGGVVRMQVAPLLVRDGRGQPRFILLTGQLVA